jgi:hypothetical protein
MVAPIILTKGAREEAGEYDVDMSQANFCGRYYFSKYLLNNKAVV